MSNKVLYGLKNVHIAAITEGPTGEITYGEPKAMPGAVSLSMEPQGESAKKYADDILYFVADANDGYEATLTMANIPDWFYQDYLGQKSDNGKILVESGTDTQKPFAMLFEFTGDEKAVRHVLYYCIASRPKDEGETKGENIEPKDKELTITSKATGTGDYIKARTTDETPEDVYNSWYTTVHEPDFTTQP